MDLQWCSQKNIYRSTCKGLNKKWNRKLDRSFRGCLMHGTRCPKTSSWCRFLKPPSQKLYQMLHHQKSTPPSTDVCTQRWLPSLFHWRTCNPLFGYACTYDERYRLATASYFVLVLVSAWSCAQTILELWPYLARSNLIWISAYLAYIYQGVQFSQIWKFVHIDHLQPWGNLPFF